MTKACDLKKGSLVGIRGLPHVLENLSITTPSARGAASIYHFRFRNLITKAKQDISCKGEEPFDDIDFERRPVQYLYRRTTSTPSWTPRTSRGSPFLHRPSKSNSITWSKTWRALPR